MTFSFLVPIQELTHKYIRDLSSGEIYPYLTRHFLDPGGRGGVGWGVGRSEDLHINMLISIINLIKYGGQTRSKALLYKFFFIRPKSDHGLPMSLTDSLTH